MSRLRLVLLGRFEAHPDDGPPSRSLGGKGQALLAYLALPPGQTRLREELAALLWDDLPAGKARLRLRQLLFDLRRGLPPDVLRLDGDLVALDPARVEVDVTRFEATLAEGTPEALERAAALYRGDLLAGLVVQAPPFEEWLAAERERLRERAVEALARLCAHQRAAGALEAAVDTGLRLLALDALQEPIHRTLMRLYTDLGRRGAALRQYQACVAALQQELGVEPDAETQLLYQDILRARARGPGALPEAAARDRAALRPPDWPVAETPLVGRGREQARLQAALDAAWRGTGRVVALVGEAGIGKSRLAAGLATEVVRRGGGLLAGHGYPSEQALPFGPWLDALRAGQVATDIDLLARLDPPQRIELGRLLHPTGPSPAGPLDLRQLFDAVTQLLERAAARQPLLLVLEDLHWADELSVRLLAFLGRRLARNRALVLVTAREEDLADNPTVGRSLDELAREGVLETLSLLPLSREETAELVRHIAPRSTPPEVLRILDDDAWRIGEGNPFVVVEAVQAGGEGASPADRPKPALPDTVQALVVRRFEGLSDEGQRLVAAAAVIGRESDFTLLRETAGLADEAAVEGVEELVRRRLFRTSGDIFTLAHDRIRAVVYQRLVPPRRALLHRRAAEVLEARRGTAGAPDPFILGSHYHQGGAWHQAVPHLQEAAELAAQRFAHREAVATSGTALAALAQLPDDPATRGRAYDLRMLRAFSLVFLGEYDAVLTHYDLAARDAEVLADDDRLTRVLAARVTALALLGRYAEAGVTGERALGLAVSREDLTGQAWVHLGLARVCLDTGDYPGCEHHARAVAGCQQGLPMGTPAMIPLLPPVLGDQYWLAVCYATRGDLAEALAVARSMRDAAERLGGPLARIWADYALARVHLQRGDAEDARAILEPLLGQSREAEFWAFTRIAWALGAACAQGGRVAEALALLEEALAYGRSIRFASGLAQLLIVLAEAYLPAGRMADAERLAREALDLARRLGERGNETEALRVLGAIEAHRDPPDRSGAEDAYGQALALAATLGRRPTEARCRLGLGRLYGRTGQPARARAEFVLAAERFRALGMTAWLTRAESELEALPGEAR